MLLSFNVAGFDSQNLLFSATMPKQIQRIAQRHLHDPQEISIKSKTATAATIRQRYWLVSGFHKLDALTRILEVEPFDAMLMFVRTKVATVELAERLEARGYAAAALNGDMPQKQREQMIDRLKKGTLDILVATDVAARGLDVDRISHVVNYDIPYDTEAYIHRIGRTGRAGRQGDAILFVAPRERRMLGAIEKATRQKIELLKLPSTEVVNNKRIADFKQAISDTIAAGELEFMQGLLEQYQQEHDIPALEIAAALAKMSMGDKTLLLKPGKERPAGKEPQPNTASRTEKTRRVRPDKADARPARGKPPEGMLRYRVEVGHQHSVKPGNIVGAIANEAGLDAGNIGRIDIQNDHSLVDLPTGMPKEVFHDLRKARVCGQRLDISLLDGSERGSTAGAMKPAAQEAACKCAKKLGARADAERRSPNRLIREHRQPGRQAGFEEVEPGKVQHQRKKHGQCRNAEEGETKLRDADQRHGNTHQPAAALVTIGHDHGNGNDERHEQRADVDLPVPGHGNI